MARNLGLAGFGWVSVCLSVCLFVCLCVCPGSFLALFCGFSVLVSGFLEGHFWMSDVESKNGQILGSLRISFGICGGDFGRLRTRVGSERGDPTGQVPLRPS